MPFSSLSAGQRIRVMLQLLGGPEYSAQLKAASRQTRNLGAATRSSSAAMVDASRKTFLQSQALYTLRRYSFYATTGLIALIAEVGRLGFSYSNALQTSRVALQPVIKDTRELNNEMRILYGMAVLSPLNYRETVTAFRTMFLAFHNVGLSAAFTNRTLQAMINSLSAAGKTAPGQLNRASVQLQHLAQLGIANGQILLALNRDGLPVYPALRKELGLTGSSLENMGRSGLTAIQVIQALNKYVSDTPGYMNAALRQSNLTLSGAWQQFRDILGQAASGAEGGLFTGLQHLLTGVNTQLAPLLRGGKPITLYDIANAMDNQLTPGTHLLINSFITLDTATKTIITEFGLFFKTIGIILYPLDKLAGLFGANHFAAQLLGVALGTLATLWLINKTRTLAMAEAQAVARFATMALNRTMGVEAVAAMGKGIAGLTEYAFATKSVAISEEEAAIAGGGIWKQVYANNGIFAKSIRVIRGAAVATWGFVTATTASTRALIAEKYAAIEAWAASLGPITLVIAAVVALIAAIILVIKYWKQLKQLTGGLQSPTIGGGNQPPSPTTRHVNQAIHKHTGFLGHIPGYNWLIHHWNPGFAAGGTMAQSGLAMVGERGPELVKLPGGSQIIPTHKLPGTVTGQNALSLHITVVPQPIILDGKELTEVIATVVTDMEARQ